MHKQASFRREIDPPPSNHPDRLPTQNAGYMQLGELNEKGKGRLHALSSEKWSKNLRRPL